MRSFASDVKPSPSEGSTLMEGKINQIQINMKQNNPLWEAIKFLLVLFLILLIATPQLVIAVLLLILMGAILELIRALSPSTSSDNKRTSTR